MHQKILCKVSKHQAHKSILRSKTMHLLEDRKQVYFCHIHFITEPHHQM